MAPLRSDQRGFTIVEVLVAAVLLMVGVLGSIALIDNANAGTSATRAREGGVALAREVVEGVRAVPYLRLTQAGVVGELRAQPGLDGTITSSGLRLERRGFSYDVATTVCSLDDEKDGTGVHGGTFCADAAAAGTADKDPDDYRRVTVVVTWRGRGTTGRVEQATLVGNPGNAVGPAVRTLAMTAPGSTCTSTCLITQSRVDAPNATFEVVTSTPAQTVGWWVDGVFQGAATPASGSRWTFAWAQDAVVDGTYDVTARAVDALGLSGLARALQVTVNRNVPERVRGLVGGWNAGQVELEWLATRDRDLVEYRVERSTDPGAASGETVSWQRVSACTTREASCVDPSPPASTTYYRVMGVDAAPDGSGPREGPRSAVRTIERVANTPPSPPTGVCVSSSGGAVRLTWQLPAVPDADPGDAIEFFRIYRDGAGVADRYDRTGSGTDTAYTDVRPGGGGHLYSVTSVDTRYAESTQAPAAACSG